MECPRFVRLIGPWWSILSRESLSSVPGVGASVRAGQPQHGPDFHAHKARNRTSLHFRLMRSFSRGVFPTRELHPRKQPRLPVFRTASLRLDQFPHASNAIMYFIGLGNQACRELESHYLPACCTNASARLAHRQQDHGKAQDGLNQRVIKG